MLAINNLSFFLDRHHILNSLNATFEPGVLNAIYGKNGIGKTTLFNCIYGLLKYTGQIHLDGKVITKDDVSYMMSETYFYPNLLGIEYLSIFENNINSELFNVDKLAELLGVPLYKNIDSFSTGMKKKIAFLAAIKLNKAVFLFDEPFNGVDHESIEIMNNIIKTLVGLSKIVIINSHIQNHLIEFADLYLIMENENYRQILKNDFIEYLQEFKSGIYQSIRETLL